MCLNSPRHSEVQWRFCLCHLYFLPISFFLFFLGRMVWSTNLTQGQLFCLFCLKISISWPVTVSYFVDQLTRGRRAGGGGGCLWFQLVPVCDCFSVPGQVCPNLTLLHIGILECALYGDVFRFVSLSFRIRSGLSPFGFITLSNACAKMLFDSPSLSIMI